MWKWWLVVCGLGFALLGVFACEPPQFDATGFRCEKEKHCLVGYRCVDRICVKAPKTNGEKGDESTGERVRSERDEVPEATRETSETTREADDAGARE